MLNGLAKISTCVFLRLRDIDFPFFIGAVIFNYLGLDKAVSYH